MPRGDWRWSGIHSRELIRRCPTQAFQPTSLPPDLLAVQQALVRARRYGVYFIFKSMEQVPTFRCTVPKYPTGDPHHCILAPQRSRFTHYYF